jgi:tungstate transport system substrate-binding protein
MAVNPRQHPHVHYGAAERYIEWLTSERVQKRIGEYRFQGKVLFHPNAERNADAS